MSADMSVSVTYDTNYEYGGFCRVGRFHVERVGESIHVTFDQVEQGQVRKAHIRLPEKAALSLAGLVSAVAEGQVTRADGQL